MEAALLPQPPECVVVTKRVFGYNRATLYRAWTTPRYLMQWWGPNGFTNTFNEYDLKPGGRWDFVMHGPDGHAYKNLSIFVLTEPEKRLVWNHVSPPEFQIDVTFEDAGNNSTLVTFRMVFETEDACNKLRGFVTDKNEENFNRLEDVLKTMTNN
jgi:uncharacterized protein YndB with AHSA1/START domain